MLSFAPRSKLCALITEERADNDVNKMHGLNKAARILEAKSSTYDYPFRKSQNVFSYYNWKGIYEAGLQIHVDSSNYDQKNITCCL